MASYSCAAAIGANPAPIKSSKSQIFTNNDRIPLQINPRINKSIPRINRPIFAFHRSCSNFSSATILHSETEEEEEENFSEDEEEEEEGDEDGNGPTQFPAAAAGTLPPMRQQRRRYRKQYPGEKNGITEEMRFIAMKLRSSGRATKSKRKSQSDEESEEDGGGDDEATEKADVSDGGGGNGEPWQPTIEGFLKYLVDSKLVFSTIERIVDQSDDVSYAYFRKTGLERADCISRDLEWFSQQGNVIPEPGDSGVDYSKYLEELAETNPPLFLCHFYNIYFSHIAGGQVIAKKVSEKILEGKVLELYTWEGDEEKLLQGVREKLNRLGEHWSRSKKNKCLRDITKAFRYMGQIVKLIVC